MRKACLDSLSETDGAKREVTVVVVIKGDKVSYISKKSAHLGIKCSIVP
ncbi:hypothetical protein [Paenibacillus sp. NPDC057934]